MATDDRSLIWDLADMTRSAYTQLPWAKKRELLLKHGWTQTKVEKIAPSTSGSYLYDRYLEFAAHLKDPERSCWLKKGKIYE